MGTAPKPLRSTGWASRRERLGLPAQPAHGALVLELAGAQELGHHDREQPVVPHEIDLVVVCPPPSGLSVVLPGGDLVRPPGGPTHPWRSPRSTRIMHNHQPLIEFELTDEHRLDSRDGW